MSSGKQAKKDSMQAELGLSGIKGMLNIWILSLLSKKPMNGYEMLKEIGDAMKHHWEPTSGALYPALHKLQKKGLIIPSKAGSRHKIVYHMTPRGKELVVELRKKITDIHGQHKFRHMFETLIWPNESEAFRQEINDLTESLIVLRNSKTSEKEKIEKIRKAGRMLK